MQLQFIKLFCRKFKHIKKKNRPILAIGLDQEIKPQKLLYGVCASQGQQFNKTTHILEKN